MNKWYTGFVPKWVVAYYDPKHEMYSEKQHKHGYREPLFPQDLKGYLENIECKVKGKHYEYCIATFANTHTHNSMILKRKTR